jgi:hypothetical protein
MNRNNLSNSARRATYYGIFMALLVFGGLLYYLADTRPRSYRAEGGDLWVFEHFQTSPEQQKPFLDELSAKLRDFDSPGFWGAEVLTDSDGKVTLLTRWQSQKAYQSFLAAPKPLSVSIQPILKEIKEVSSRR